MKINIKLLLLVSIFFAASCESLVEDINENPNDILIDDVQAELFLTGAMLANTSAQETPLAISLCGFDQIA